uniref:Phosphoacetylglucosamine mutase n=1 Tax=Dracunculus medinensis TaxID=318479 RepID=A0A0N4U557_DRAME
LDFTIHDFSIIPDRYTRLNNRDHLGELVRVGENMKFEYGTAGFRTNAKYMPFIAFRMGILAAVRARNLMNNTGLMITASHNLEEDNGIKLIDPTGDMLEETWETIANNFGMVTSVYSKKLNIDCANGVGGTKFKEIMVLAKGLFEINLCNIDGPLNYKCGADYVKIAQDFPINMENIPIAERCASFDGDADRIVYFFRNKNNKFQLLDGDKIASLIAIAEANLEKKCTIGVVQTAYSNGSSTKFLTEELGLPVSIVPTGVKYLHKEAHKFDVGIYFEANGHGTVLFSERFLSEIHSNTSNQSVCNLKYFVKIINSVVGDAMADLLIIESILKYYDWSIEDWALKLYVDRPSCQIKVKVRDRSIFKTTYDQLTCLSPEGIQKFIDEKAVDGSRCFIRPSGTENIVRVYAEASTEEKAKELADLVAKEVGRIAADHK